MQVGPKLEPDAKKETDTEDRYTDIGKVKNVDVAEVTETNTEFLNPVYSEGEPTH